MSERLHDENMERLIEDASLLALDEAERYAPDDLEPLPETTTQSERMRHLRLDLDGIRIMHQENRRNPGKVTKEIIRKTHRTN